MSLPGGFKINKSPDPAKQRHKYFERPVRTPRALVYFLEVRKAHNTRIVRQRKRRGEGLKIHQLLVESIVANLAYATIDEGSWTNNGEARLAKTIAVSLSRANKTTRYDRRIYRQLPNLLRVMRKLGLLKLRLSKKLGRRSTIEPTASFAREVKAAGITFDDFERDKHEELIVLSRTEKGFGLDGNYGKKHRRIDYEDTAETRRYRTELESINAFLAETNLEFATKGAAPTLTVDINRRRLVRYFTLPPWQEDDRPRFDLGGRLFGGWWENLPREERHRIRIDGETVVDIDFASMFPRLAFLKLGIEPPMGDLYAVPGLEDPKFRDGVKGAMNTLLFANGPKARLPTEFSKQLPRRWTLAKVKAAILSRHPDLEPALEIGLGLELMFTESRILVAVLKRLVAEGTICLCLHDSLIAPTSKVDQVRKAMEETAAKVAGFRLPTAVKRLEG